MRRLLLCIVALVLLLPSLALSYDVLVLQSKHNPAYDEVLKGFGAGQDISRRVVVLSDFDEVDVVRIVREEHPRLILAIGDNAVSAARPVRTIPVVALMSLSLHRLKPLVPNLTGIGMFVDPERYLHLFRDMKVRRVGVVYNPARSAWYLHQALSAAQQAGISLVLREVSNSRDTLAQLASLEGKVDALWMLPDSMAVTRETTEAYFYFSLQQSVPVISFASSYLGLGATAVLDLDRRALGRQAREMVADLLEGDRLTNIPLSYPKGVILKTNYTVLKRLGIDHVQLK